MEDRASDELDPDQLLGRIEFCCWSALAMAPIIYWLQGPSVSHDQFVVRTALVVIAAVSAIGLRIKSLLQRKRRSHSNDLARQPGATEPDDSIAKL